MKRRKFLTVAGIGGAVAALVSLRFFTTSFESAAAALIRKELGFLQLETEGLRQFVYDYSRNKDHSYKWAVKGYSLLGIGSNHSGKIHHLISSYLLSTDFFSNNMDESRVVRYQGLFNPYQRPCTHPFSHSRYSGQEV